MKALSVRAPWWWFILHGGKNIENRSWPTKFRGTVGLHASKWYSMAEALPDMEFGVDVMRKTRHLGPVGVERLTHRILMPAGGHLVGTVEVVDCVDHSDSPWFFGDYGFVLRNPVAFIQPIPCKGALSFFDVTAVMAEAGAA